MLSLTRQRSVRAALCAARAPLACLCAAQKMGRPVALPAPRGSPKVGRMRQP